VPRVTGTDPGPSPLPLVPDDAPTQTFRAPAIEVSEQADTDSTVGR
jgi:hypothetical protein